MQVTRYMPGENPVGITGFVTVFPHERTPGVVELDADRDQVAQQLGGPVNQVWADSHAVVFGLAHVGDQEANPSATKAVNYLFRVRGKEFAVELKGPVLVVQQPDPTREVVQLVVSNAHQAAFQSFIHHYHDQRDEALQEAAEDHYNQWLETREPGDQYVVSENDHSLDGEPDDFEVIYIESGMFSHVYHLIFLSVHCAMHFGLEWSQRREQLATPGALANLTEEQQQALKAAGSLPNSWAAIAALHKLATPGFWEPREQGIVAVVSYEEEGETQSRATPLVLTASNQQYICRLHNIAMRLVWRQLVPPVLPVGQAHYPPLVSSENVLVGVVFSSDIAPAFSAAARNNSLVQVLSEVPFRMGEEEDVRFMLSATHAQYLFWLAYSFGKAQQALVKLPRTVREQLVIDSINSALSDGAEPGAWADCGEVEVEILLTLVNRLTTIPESESHG